MLNYNKNKLINNCLVKYYETFANTLDTADYVPQKYNDKILKYIFKNMKRQFRKLDREDRPIQWRVRRKSKVQIKRMKAEVKVQLNFERKCAKVQARFLRSKAKQDLIAERKRVKADLKRLKQQAKNKTDKEIENNVK